MGTIYTVASEAAIDALAAGDLYAVQDVSSGGLKKATHTQVRSYLVATVAAAGSTAADAAALTANTFTLVSGPNDTKGVVLPAASPGLWVKIKVGDGADLKVWPATGDAINALGADNALTVVDDVCFELIAYDSTTWYTLPLLPS